MEQARCTHHASGIFAHKSVSRITSECDLLLTVPRITENMRIHWANPLLRVIRLLAFAFSSDAGALVGPAYREAFQALAGQEGFNNFFKERVQRNPAATGSFSASFSIDVERDARLGGHAADFNKIKIPKIETQRGSPA